MNREEALKQFKEDYVQKKRLEKILELNEYYENNKEKLALEFIESFKNICNKIEKIQIEEKKEAIGYITYSMLLTEIVEHNYVYIVEAFNKLWFLDNEECKVKYDASWAFNFLEELEVEMEAERKLYMSKITAADVEKIKLKEAKYYNCYIIELAKYALENIEELEEFNKLKREEKFQVRVGEYMDVSEIVYCEEEE
jgi:hypothetical protein